MTIRRVAAPVNSFGFSNIVAGQYKVFGGGLANYSNSCERTNRTNNVETVFGTTAWRNPSNYSRFVRVYSNVQSSLFGSSSWIVPGGSPSGMISITDLSGYWANNVQQVGANALAESNTLALLSIQGSKAQIGNALAESKKTVEQIATAALTLFRAYRYARKGYWKAVERELGLNGSGKVLYGQFPANRWLEYQYGWKPLMSDIHDAYGLIRGDLNVQKFLVYGKGSSKRSSNVSNTLRDPSAGITYRRIWDAEQVTFTRLVGELSSVRWHQAAQVGLINPLSIAWEVVPFSFVVDWFMPVGNVLEALTARAGLTFRSGTITNLTGGTCRISVDPSSTPRPSVLGSLQMDCYFMQRIKLADWPLPMFYAKESPFSTTHVLSALALWRSTLR